MTHEELIAQIRHYGMLEPFMAGILEEVANLHKPNMQPETDSWCMECTTKTGIPRIYTTYPCPTIKKIWEGL